MKKESAVNEGRSIPDLVRAQVGAVLGKGVAKAVPLVVEDTRQHVRPKHPDAYCQRCMADGAQSWSVGCEECEAFAEAMRGLDERESVLKEEDGDDRSMPQFEKKVEAILADMMRCARARILAHVGDDATTKVMTPINPLWEEFADKLDAAIRAEGCDASSLRLSERLLRATRGIDADRSLDFFRTDGGYCDCEVLMNVGQ